MPCPLIFFDSWRMAYPVGCDRSLKREGKELVTDNVTCDVIQIVWVLAVL